MADVPKRPVPAEQTTVLKPPSSQIVRPHPQLIRKQICSADRFIVRRSEYNVEAANYLLKKKPSLEPKKHELDVVEQVQSLGVRWRRKCMHQLFLRENVISGVGQKQVLRAAQLPTENKLPGNLVAQPKEFWDEEQFEDGIWKSKPRKRPSIGIMDAILDMPRLRPVIYSQQRFCDWSCKNIIAAAIQDSVSFYNAQIIRPAELSPIEHVSAGIVKWSNSGDKLLLSTKMSKICLYDTTIEKIIWRTTCECMKIDNFPCTIRCACWSYKDRYIVIGCRGILTVYSAITGMSVNKVVAHNVGLFTVCFSPNYRYLVTTAPDTSVRIFLWPSLLTYLDINYYEPIKAVAWHPQESGLLCVGGGLGDASLSLWNVNKVDPLTYRRVPFHGAVENLAWNKVSGELVVHWSYWESGRRCPIMAVLGSLDRVVDVVPVEVDTKINCIMWNSDHTQLATQADDYMAIWNFFGNEYKNRRKHLKGVKDAEVRKSTDDRSLRGFRHFNIR